MTRIRLSPVLAAHIICGLVALRASVSLGAQEPHEGADFQRRREAWFNDQRAYPGRDVDWNAMARVRQQVLLARTGYSGFAALAGLSSGSWSSMGPSGFFGVGYWDSGPQVDAGRIDAIALHPTATGTIFVASPNGGLWRTTTSGASWSPLFDTQCTLQMSNVRIDPVNPSIMYAGARYSSGAVGCSLFRSTDGGLTWGTWNGDLNFTAYNGGFIRELFIDPLSAGTTNATTMMFSFGSAGIYHSTNSGTSWTRTLPFGFVTSIVALPGKPGVVFAGVADYATTTSARTGLYRSDNNGANWTLVSSGSLDFTSTGRIEIDVSAAEPNSVWLLAGGKNSRFQAIGKWNDITSTMTALAGTGINLATSGRTAFGSQATYDLALAIDPTNANRLYIGGVRAFRSTDGGATFSAMGTEIHCDWQTIVVDPRNTRQLYAGTDGGIFMSTDAGASWISRNSGLVVSMFYPGISQHPTDPNIVLGGLQDNGTLMSNGTQWFNAVTGGDGGFGAINYTTPGTAWTTCQWSSTSGPCIYRRVNVGGNFSSNVRTGIVASDRAQFIPPLVMDPVTPTTLYFGTMRLYRTVNNGVLWSPISPDLTKGAGTIKAIAVAKSDPLTTYVGTSDGNVQVTRDGGTTWTLSTNGLPNRTVTDFAIDHTTPSRALVSFSGSGTSHLYLTADAGISWTSVDSNLPNMPASAVVMIDDGPNHFFIGTDVGVYETTDAGLTWTNSPSGMPNVIVTDLSYNTTTRQLVASTYGRGLFRYSLANPAAVLRGDVNRDGAVNAADALLIQQALIGMPLAAGLTISPHGDANCDGRIDATDALIVLRAAVGTPTAGACVGTNR